jgi:hypothetical protein
MGPKTCAEGRHSRHINGAMRREEQRSHAMDGVIILDAEQAKRAASFEHICRLVAAYCAFCESVA